MIFSESIGSNSSLSENKLKFSALRWAFFGQDRREEAVSLSRVATIPLPGRSKTSPGLPQVRPAGRGHARFCNLLIIKYHSYQSVETMAFFGCVSTPRFITH